MTLIRREECPVHGVNYGVTTTIGHDRWCQHCGRPANKLVMVDYVRADLHRGAVAALRTLREYLIEPEGDGPIRYSEAIELIDATLATVGGQ